jgi:hypothetical protein
MLAGSDKMDTDENRREPMRTGKTVMKRGTAGDLSLFVTPDSPHWQLTGADWLLLAHQQITLGIRVTGADSKGCLIDRKNLKLTQ